jgi:hypothetical protein
VLIVTSPQRDYFTSIEPPLSLTAQVALPCTKSS